ncbi:MAG: peptide chain release factor 2 [Thermanaeromonas sp.]|uniref:peptide chain release factor 2 n=1 Tax=Thermanaeromonas sp. TaxID=2003697 RepID=UPI00243EE5D9|nr:peptide chain release factor 2 [Thermanaeromonas sp.]MCG0277438.1 peptide chain release factor 2 [Thermanaeromonas sp.]
MLEDLKPRFAELKGRLEELRVSLDWAGKKEEIARLEAEMSSPDFWEDRERVEEVTRRLSSLKEKVQLLEELTNKTQSLYELWELAVVEGEQSLEPELKKELENLEYRVEKITLETLLAGPYDRNNAILSLHPGAGGTESQDWAAMLLRMYTRWAEEHGYEVELLDYLEGEEAGIKSATLLIKGENAYGYLKAEKGVHRLVRISPFDAAGRRHTSFASVEVIPEVEFDHEVEIRPEDLKIDTFRSQGAGGQHVNKTDSAVRITHLPTGIVVTCQNERSQHANRLTALKILRAKLLERKLKEQEEELAKLKGEQREIAWGNQIRSYVFHPYSLVKDHRTGVEIGNVQAVMDGWLDPFINAYLRQQAGKGPS